MISMNTVQITFVQLAVQLVYSQCTASIQLVYNQFITSLPLLYNQCKISIQIVHNQCTTSVKLLYNQCTTSEQLVYNQCTTSVQLYTTSVQLVYNQCTSSVQLVYNQCTTSVQLMQRQCTISEHLLYNQCTTNVQLVYNQCTASVQCTVCFSPLPLLMMIVCTVSPVQPDCNVLYTSQSQRGPELHSSDCFTPPDILFLIFFFFVSGIISFLQCYKHSKNSGLNFFIFFIENMSGAALGCLVHQQLLVSLCVSHVFRFNDI